MRFGIYFAIFRPRQTINVEISIVEGSEEYAKNH
jgi:hypothetical protein